MTTLYRPRIVAAPDDLYEDETIELSDLPAISAALKGLKRLVNDPIALLDRARGLLEGTAPRLLGLASPVLLIGTALAGMDWPGSWDDALRVYLVYRAV